GAGIAEVERRRWIGKARHADAVDLPGALARALYARAKRSQDLPGIEDVFAFKQPRDARAANRQRRQDQGPVRDRLVTWGAHTALKGAAARAGHRPGSC